MAKILVVDDSRMARRMLRRILEPAGYEVLEAENGMSALERFFLDRPDLVMLDLAMEGMSGFDVLRKLREIEPQARVVIATADIQKMTRQLAEEAGAAGFVTKPFVPDEVLDIVRAVLEGGGK